MLDSWKGLIETHPGLEESIFEYFANPIQVSLQ